MLLSTLNTSIKSPNPHPIDRKLKLRSQITWKEHSPWRCVQKARSRFQPFLHRAVEWRGEIGWFRDWLTQWHFLSGRFQHSLSPRSPAGKTMRPTSRFRIPHEIMTSPSLKTRSTTALQPASTPCTWASSPRATMSTSTPLPALTANWTTKRATTRPRPTPGCEGEEPGHARGTPGTVHVHAYHGTFRFFSFPFLPPPADLVC